MSPDTRLSESARPGEVSDDQETSRVFAIHPTLIWHRSRSESSMKYPVAGVRFDSAEGLGNLLLQIRAAVSEGILQQYKPENGVMALDDIEMLNTGGPWLDYIEAYFVDPVSGRKYRLIAETYHGSVAKWEQI